MPLKREQIIKALECCTEGDCYPCSYGNIGAGCRDKMCEDALRLINELTEENKAWQMQLIDKEEKADKAYYELACEVEDLRAENERLRDTAYRLECEVHRERANTVRKMQEMLKKCFNNEMEHAAIYTEGQVLFAIDQIAEEMLEDIE